MAHRPEPPYWAVIFPNQQSGDVEGYGEMAEAMVALAADQPGFLGIDSARGADGFGVTVSYWADEESIAAWKAVSKHRAAQDRGIDQWYSSYEVIVAEAKRTYRGPAGRERA